MKFSSLFLHKTLAEIFLRLLALQKWAMDAFREIQKAYFKGIKGMKAFALFGST